MAVQTDKPPSIVRRFLVAYGADQAATTAIYLTLAWAVIRSGSPAWAMALLIASPSVVKVVVMASVGGALADRHGPTQTARATVLLRMVVLGCLLLALQLGSVLALFVGALTYGLVDGVHEPALRAVSTVLKKEQRGLQGSLDVVGRIGRLGAGPLVGLLISWLGAPAAIASTIAVLALTLAALPQVKPPPRAPSDASLRSLFSESWEAWQRAATAPEVRFILVVFACANILLTPPVIAGLPLLTDVRTWPALALGLLSAGYQGGSLAGAVIAQRKGDSVHRVYLVSLLSLIPAAASVASLAWLSWWPGAVAVLFVAGVSSGLGPALLGGELKEQTPPEMQGRTQGVLATINIGVGPLGYGLLAALAGWTPVPWAVAAFGVALLMVTPVLLRTAPGP